MGTMKRLMIARDELRGIAESVAVAAGAVKACLLHSDILIDQYDDEALKLAYKIGNARVSRHAIDLPEDLSRRDLTDMIKRVVSDSAIDCPRCEKQLSE